LRARASDRLRSAGPTGLRPCWRGLDVNGAATTGPRELHAGDRVTFASVTAQLESSGADETNTMPAMPAGAAVVHQIDEQVAGVINNNDRDQYISYVQNFLREVAATKTKARWLAWTGFLMFVVGFARAARRPQGQACMCRRRIMSDRIMLVTGSAPLDPHGAPTARPGVLSHRIWSSCPVSSNLVRSH
jgi:hypothetical protein